MYKLLIEVKCTALAIVFYLIISWEERCDDLVIRLGAVWKYCKLDRWQKDSLAMLHYSYSVLVSLQHLCLFRVKTKALDQHLAWLFAADLSKTRFLTWEGLTFISMLEITMLSFCNKRGVQARHSAPLSSKCQRNPTAAWFLCTPHRSWNENAGGGAQSQFAS